jgi:hypothetical protein
MNLQATHPEDTIVNFILHDFVTTKRVHSTFDHCRMIKPVVVLLRRDIGPIDRFLLLLAVRRRRFGILFFPFLSHAVSCKKNYFTTRGGDGGSFFYYPQFRGQID